MRSFDERPRNAWMQCLPADRRALTYCIGPAYKSVPIMKWSVDDSRIIWLRRWWYRGECERHPLKENEKYRIFLLTADLQGVLTTICESTHANGRCTLESNYRVSLQSLHREAIREARIQSNHKTQAFGQPRGSKTFASSIISLGGDCWK